MCDFYWFVGVAVLTVAAIGASQTHDPDPLQNLVFLLVGLRLNNDDARRRQSERESKPLPAQVGEQLSGSLRV